jgi:hypothetical protein
VNYGTPVEDFTRGATSGGTICLVSKSVDYVLIDSSIEPSSCIYDDQYVTLYNTRTYDSRELHINAGTGPPRLYYDIWESKYDDPQETWGEIECPNGASACIDGVSPYGYYKNIDQGRCTNPSGCGGGGWIPRGEMWYKSYYYQCDVMVSSGGMKGYRSGYLDLVGNSNVRRVDYCRSGYNEYDSNRCYKQAVIPPEN